MKTVATALAAVLVALVALTFAGCASQPIPEPTRTAATPEVAAPAAPASSCRQAGRTTMVRGDCPIVWDGETVRVSGACDVTPGTTSAGRSCLRLQTKAASADCSVGPWVRLSSCTADFVATLLKKNGELHELHEGTGDCRVVMRPGSTVQPALVSIIRPAEVVCR